MGLFLSVAAPLRWASLLYRKQALATFDFGVEKVVFDAASQWLFVRYADGRIYLIDVE